MPIGFIRRKKQIIRLFKRHYRWAHLLDREKERKEGREKREMRR